MLDFLGAASAAADNPKDVKELYDLVVRSTANAMVLDIPVSEPGAVMEKSIGDVELDPIVDGPMAVVVEMPAEVTKAELVVDTELTEDFVVLMVEPVVADVIGLVLECVVVSAKPPQDHVVDGPTAELAEAEPGIKELVAKVDEP